MTLGISPIPPSNGLFLPPLCDVAGFNDPGDLPNLGVMIFRFKKLPFPFGKIVNSVSKDFLNGNSVWPLTLYTKIPFTNQIKKKYELRIRVLSKSHVISKPLRHRLQD